LQLKYPNTLFVEDNCEGLLGSYDGVKSGTASYASAVSFYGNKTLTSGEGGAIITNDENAYLFAKCVQGQGQSKQRFIHNELGYNYRMTNIQAAILYGQLELTNTIADMKRSVFDTYRNALKNREDVLLQSIEPGTEHSNWMFGVRVPGHSNYEAAELYFRQEGIEIRPMFYPITAHMHIVRRQNVSIGDCSNADTLNKECFILPSYPDLKQSEQSHILNVLNNYLGTLK
jgi:perosamine synthetase